MTVHFTRSQAPYQFESIKDFALCKLKLVALSAKKFWRRVSPESQRSRSVAWSGVKTFFFCLLIEVSNLRDILILQIDKNCKACN